MPLHLLGKKSWNVYNSENVARVRKDEAEAAAREAVEEARQQEEDVQRRLCQLRGDPEPSATVTAPHSSSPRGKAARCSSGGGQEKKRKRLHGEDDTERDIRYAKEQLAPSERHKSHQDVLKRTNIAPLIEDGRNFNLFPDARNHLAEDTERIKDESSRRAVDGRDGSMRFSDAAGFEKNIKEEPWYHGGEFKSKKRKSQSVENMREEKALAFEDPLKAMRSGVNTVKQLKKERNIWKNSRMDETRVFHHSSRHIGETRELDRSIGEDLDGFSLDTRLSRDDHQSHNRRRHENQDSRSQHRHRHRRQERTEDNRGAHRSFPEHKTSNSNAEHDLTV